jgi:REP element-mobilizing transposase RayT
MKSNRHSIYNLNYRLVVIKEYRHPVIDEQIKKRLVENAHNLFSKWKCELIEFNDLINILNEKINYNTSTPEDF